MKREKKDYTKHFIFIAILLAAFVNFKNPAIGSLIVLSIEICIIITINNNILTKSRSNIIIYNKKEISTIILYMTTVTSSTILSIDGASEEKLLFSLVRYIEIFFHIFTILKLSIYFYFYKNTGNIFKLIPISIVIASVICLMDFHLNPNSVMGNTNYKLIVSYNIRQIGYVVMLGCLFCIINLTLAGKNHKVIIFYSILFLINCSFLFWLGGRGAILALISSIILSVLVIHKDYMLKIKSLLSTLILMIISYLISIPFSVFTWNGSNRFFVLSQNLDAPLINVSIGRFMLWQESLSLIAKKPFFGYGPEAHAFETKIGYLQPHNALLQSLLEFGIVGTIPFLIMIIYIVKNATVNAIAEPTVNNLFCFGLISAILIHSLYSGPLYHATSMILVCIASAYILSVTLKRENRRLTDK